MRQKVDNNKLAGAAQSGQTRAHTSNLTERNPKTTKIRDLLQKQQHVKCKEVLIRQ